jgi:4-amino-4-deoxy-L-arabinose transferase-like glycosyltransferase
MGWPPLQVGLLTIFVFLFGSSITTIYIYSFVFLFLLITVTTKLLKTLELKGILVLLPLVVFVTNPFFLHHLFTLNLRFGELLAILSLLLVLVRYQKEQLSKYLYLMVVISILAMLYRLTSIFSIVPVVVAFFIICKDKKQLVKPLLLAMIGIALLLGIHFVELKLLGISFLQRAEMLSDNVRQVSGFYFLYDFSTYFRGEGDNLLNTFMKQRYQLAYIQKFVFAFSSFFFTGIIFFIGKRYNFKNKILFFTLLAIATLYLIFYSFHGSKPDYLLPMLLAIALFFSIFVQKH